MGITIIPYFKIALAMEEKERNGSFLVMHWTSLTERSF
jgi:hypothetical protein